MKETLLDLLIRKQGETVSGEELAAKLGVSRAAVWKEIRRLREEGRQITAEPGKGYRLSMEEDVLSKSEIERLLGPLAKRLRIRIERLVKSTNSEGKEAARQGEEEGWVMIAEEQSGGYGRVRRSFYSPRATGLYFSVLLRPKLPAGKALYITTAAAVAVAEAVEALSGKKAEIKWVNDVLVEGKKVCGILTEAGMSVENGGVDYAVLGIGVNIAPPKGGIPEELKEIIATAYDAPKAGQRNRMAAEILKRFFPLYDELPKREFYEEYKKRLAVLGKEILVKRKGEEERAEAVGIDENFRLRVRYSDGREEILSEGEVSTAIVKS